MRVLGIDPGSRFMGYGVLEESRGQVRHLGHGVLRADQNAPLEERLRSLHQELQASVALYKPDTVAVEGVFAFRNARSALILGHARGIALLVAAQSGLSVHEYSPAKVKRSVGASGAADKEGVSRMVRTFLKLESETFEREDATDALAVAICHLNQFRWSAVTPARATKPTKSNKNGFAALEHRLSQAYRPPERS